jgi:hypothetical protein
VQGKKQGVGCKNGKMLCVNYDHYTA